MSDELEFANEDELAADDETLYVKPWKVMVVDDEEEVHSVTKMALADFEFCGAKIEFLDAYSGEEAKKLIAKHPDTTVMLLDVVMEDEHAGLEVAKYIRNDLHNETVRIILRTGQPGQAPERQVILEYDINDYKTKTELTAQKLFTVLVSSLRGYSHIKKLEHNKKGLEKIIDASIAIFELQSIENFVSGVLTQITSLLDLKDDSLYAHTCSSLAAGYENGELEIIAGTGNYSNLVQKKVSESLPDSIKESIFKASKERNSIFSNKSAVIYFQSKNGAENVIYFEGSAQISDFNRRLLELFCQNVSIAFDNIYLSKEIVESQKELILAMTSVYQNSNEDEVSKSAAFGGAVRVLGEECGIEPALLDILQKAAPLRNVGKVGILESIINKEGSFDKAEYEIMKTHTWHGYNMLKQTKDELFQKAALIALQHHEKWDGSGYPQGLKGDEIDIFARIVSVANVIEALNNNKSYRKAWSKERIIEHLKEESGKSFDPTVAAAAIKRYDEIDAIIKNYSNNPQYH